MNFARTIFLTGFPGFIAARLVERLADGETRFFLLVQKAFADRAAAEVDGIARRTGARREQFMLVEGDITGENLGIAPEMRERIRRETTDVFHLAAVYDLAVERDLAFRVNVEGTRRVNEFVAALPNLNRYNYVSTCYVAGRRTGVIFETELEHDAGFRNHYEETKYLAETEVEKMKPAHPVTVYRPSVVVGDSRTGETAKYDGIYYVVKYYRIFPQLLRLVNVGNPKVTLNLVPVDFVVEGLAALSRDEKATGRTIALADPRPRTTAEICDAIVEALAGRKTILTPPARLIESSLNLPFSPVLSGLPHAGVPYFFLAQTYDTTVADELLAAHGIECPDFTDYAPTLVEFVEKNPRL